MLTTIFLLIILAIVGLAGIPLMIGIVPQNPYYGWPTRSSSSKPELWREVNMFLGRAAVIAAALAALLLMAYNGTWLKSGIAQLLVVIFALGAAAGATFWYVRKVGG
jgi:uncharacterized membrane protein